MPRVIDNEGNELWSGDNADDLRDFLEQQDEYARLNMTLVGWTQEDLAPPNGRAPGTGDQAPTTPQE